MAVVEIKNCFPIFNITLGLCEGKQKSVILHSIDPNILKLLLDFVYTGHVHIEQFNVQELLAAADMLQIPEVVSECCAFLCRELHPSNALGILRFAEAHHCEELAQNAQNYVFTNFPQVSTTFSLTLCIEMLTKENCL